MVELVKTQEGLMLTDGKLKLCADFTTEKKRLKPNNLNGEMLVKAARIKGEAAGLRLLDATAGLGEDSLLLAAAGFLVDLYEYDEVIGALLEDAMNRAENDTDLAPVIARMTLHREDSIAAMKALDYVPDVVLLDPMFPARSKSGMIKKKFQLMQQLESPCANEAMLLEAALSTGASKIVIKRPAKGPFLAGVKPSYSVDGNAIRYDCIVR